MKFFWTRCKYRGESLYKICTFELFAMFHILEFKKSDPCEMLCQKKKKKRKSIPLRSVELNG